MARPRRPRTRRGSTRWSPTTWRGAATASRTRCTTSSSPTTRSGPRSCGAGTPGTASCWPARESEAVTDADVDAKRPLVERHPRAADRHRRAGRPNLGCFGMHEWAMVYRQSEDETRHAAWPLRLGSAGTDEVVESHRIACSHFDAFRFFTDDGPSAQHALPRLARPAGLRAARLPARRDGPLQARVPALAAGAVRAGGRLLRAGPRHPRPRHARRAVRPARPRRASRCRSRPPRASRSTSPPSGSSPSVVRYLRRRLLGH